MYKKRSRFIQRSGIKINSKKYKPIDVIENKKLSNALGFLISKKALGMILPDINKVGIKCRICNKLVASNRVKIHLEEEHGIKCKIILSKHVDIKFAYQIVFYFDNEKYLVKLGRDQSHLKCSICKSNMPTASFERHLKRKHSCSMIKYFHPLIYDSEVLNDIDVTP